MSISDDRCLMMEEPSIDRIDSISENRSLAFSHLNSDLDV